jgi:hypothetical protein
VIPLPHWPLLVRRDCANIQMRDRINSVTSLPKLSTIEATLFAFLTTSSSLANDISIVRGDQLLSLPVCTEPFVAIEGAKKEGLMVGNLYAVELAIDKSSLRSNRFSECYERKGSPSNIPGPPSTTGCIRGCLCPRKASHHYANSASLGVNLKFESPGTCA